MIINYNDIIKNCKIEYKKWGSEAIITNNDEYCAKILKFNEKNSKFSMHYHLLKHETWLIVKGKFRLRRINTENADTFHSILYVGDIVTIERNNIHQLVALEENSIVFEVSTPHFDSDSYRIEKGDNQK